MSWIRTALFSAKGDYCIKKSTVVAEVICTIRSRLIIIHVHAYASGTLQMIYSIQIFGGYVAEKEFYQTV